MKHDLRLELYLSLLLLGAEPMLLSALAAWRDGTDEKDVLADLANWNEAKLAEMKEWLPTMTGSELEAAQERIRQYETARESLKQAA
jgi:CHASE3 domain sensor protein